MDKRLKSTIDNLPLEPGVYLFRGVRRKLLYVGKAGNLKRRVSSYFTKVHADKTQKLISEVKNIEHIVTSTAIEALILEADLIKKYEPPYNFKEKDDKSFLYVEITKDSYPRVLLVRGKDNVSGERFGPFTSASDVRSALRILRKIFPYNTHAPSEIGKAKRQCLNAQIGLCPGTCIGNIEKDEYKKTIRNLKLFLQGKKERLIKQLEKDMQVTADQMEFEKAAYLKKQLFALRHIQDVALISKDDPIGEKDRQRIEGYDISNIAGDFPVGSMVVFEHGKPAKSEYRKFKIRTIHQSDDVGMLREMVERRLNNDWPLPELMLIDGGKGQVNTVLKAVEEAGLKIPVVGIAKGPKRDKNEFVGKIPKGFDKQTLIRVRDEAHRFAISFHKKIRGAKFIKNE